MFWIGFVAGVVAFPIGLGLFFLTAWFSERKWSWGPCPHCSHYGGPDGVEKGFQGRYILSRKAHFYIWARTKKHRKARGDVWREADANGWQNRQWDDRFML